jgi:hypothetical protein
MSSFQGFEDEPADEPFTICGGCRQRVDPERDELIEAAEVVAVPTFGDPHGTVEGLHVLFHPSCFPVGSPRYRRVRG